uniref:Uncharacterized protein n=1 Tax=Sphaerodactylus townsendi TaxID=933632 RepID=A0ACB8FT04_9SAUR
MGPQRAERLEGDEHILGLPVVFATHRLFGIASAGSSGLEGDPLVKFFQLPSTGFHHQVVLVSWIMWYAPLGIMFLVAGKIVEMGDVVSLFTSLGKYICCCFGGHAIHGLGQPRRPSSTSSSLARTPTVSLGIFYCAGHRLWDFLQLLTTLPLMMRRVEENNGALLSHLAAHPAHRANRHHGRAASSRRAGGPVLHRPGWKQLPSTSSKSSSPSYLLRKFSWTPNSL